MAGLFETPQVPRLPTLLEEVRRGGILIPDFQRPLEWSDDQRLKLLDSVAKQMPIGAFLVWRTRTHELRCLNSLGAFNLPQVPGSQIPRAYLLDGHQRLATLIAALSWTADSSPLRKQGVRWPIYFDLEADPGDGALRFNNRRGDPPSTWLPLFALLDPKRLFDHQKRLLGAGQEVAAERAEALAERFKDYQIPVVPLVSEDLELVTDSFVRVNNEGRRMREINMVRALTYSPDRDLERELETIKAELAPLGWSDIDDQVLLNVFKVHWRLNVLESQPRTLFDRLTNEGYEQSLQTLGQSVRWAIDILADIGVRGPRSLPYAYQLIGLADVSWRLQQPKLDAAQFDRVRSWFWATSYGEYFTGMPGGRIRDSIDYLYKVLTKERTPIPPDLTREVTPLTVLNFRAVRSKALMLLTTTEIEDADLRTRTQRWLGEAGNDAVQRLFPSIAATRPENRVVALPEELNTLRNTFGPFGLLPALVLVGHVGERPQSTQDLRERRRLVLARYLVPEGKGDAMNPTQAQVEGILEARREKLDALERGFLSNLGLEIRQDESDG